MSSKNRGVLDLLEGLPVAHPSLYLLPNPLQDGESGMALVAMKNGIVHPQLAQDAYAANAKDYLLAQALLQIAGIKPVGYDAIPGIVGLAGGIDQIKAGLSHLNLPDLQINRRVHDRHLDGDGIFIGIYHLPDGCILPVHHLAGPHLPAVRRDHLTQVALRIHESYSHQRQTQVAALLEKVSRQKAETTRIKGQGLMQAVLRREVGDLAPFRLRHAGAKPASGRIHVTLKAGNHIIIMPHEMDVGCCRLQRTSIHAVDHLYRVVVAQIPALATQELEERPALGVPAPPEVVGQLSQS